jgi:hypothetical protein
MPRRRFLAALALVVMLGPAPTAAGATTNDFERTQAGGDRCHGRHLRALGAGRERGGAAGADLPDGRLRLLAAGRRSPARLGLLGRLRIRLGLVNRSVRMFGRRVHRYQP